MSMRSTHYARLLSTSAIWAAAIVAASAAILLPIAHTVGSAGVRGAIGTVLGGPGFFLAVMLQTGSGPDGAPYITDIAPHALNFLFWWVTIAVTLAWRGGSGRP